ncbi:MAG: hypothetical protein MK102_03990 [Fuerstiella sp.]|nr:hypothetical protein [Fuerstiella sp.]
MSIERAEQLKKQLTDKWVVVNSGVPELRRFEELTGRVKTVNMNCRALVEFNGPEDISWYDIDPGALTVVDAPKPKEKPAATPKEKAAPAARPAAKAAAGGSPLDKIRAQASGTKPAGGSPLDAIRAQAAGTAKPDAAKPSAGGSPLDKIRAQSTAPKASVENADIPPEPNVSESVEETPPPAPPDTPSVDTTGMSPLDIIRAQGAFKGNQ